MKKRNEQNEKQRTEPRPAADAGAKQESAADFALHLAAMFRAELGEESDKLDPVLHWNLPASESDFREAVSAGGNEDELHRAVESFLREESAAPGEAGAENPGAGAPAPGEAGAENPGAGAPAPVEAPPLPETPADPPAAEPSEELRFVLRGFDATPFVPPQEDPSLDEIFGPSVPGAAQPDHEPVRSGTPGAEEPENGAPRQKPLPERSPTDELSGDAAPSETVPSEPAKADPARTGASEQAAQSPVGKRGWLRALFGGKKREADAAAPAVRTGAEGRPAVAAKRPETRPASAEEEAKILAAMEQEIPGLAALLGYDADAPVKEAEAVAAADSAAEPAAAAEPEPESGAEESPAPASDKPFRLAAELLPDTDAAGEKKAAQPEGFTMSIEMPAKTAPAEDAQLNLILEEHTENTEEAEPEAPAEAAPEWTDKRLLTAADAVLGENVEGTQQAEDPFSGGGSGSEHEPPVAEEASVNAGQAEEAQENETHVPEIWDPLSLFSESAEEEPSPPAPLSRNTTGTLPTLEELFGPASAEEQSARSTEDPAVRPGKKRAWLKGLLRFLRREDEEDEAAPEPFAPGEEAEPAAPDAPQDAPETPKSAEAEPEAPEPEAEPAPAASESSAASVPETGPTVPAEDAAERPAAKGASADQAAAETGPQQRSAEDESPADEWNPLALFGEADTEELPTWEEYVRARRGPAAAEEQAPEAVPAEENAADRTTAAEEQAPEAAPAEENAADQTTAAVTEKAETAPAAAPEAEGAEPPERAAVPAEQKEADAPQLDAEKSGPAAKAAFAAKRGARRKNRPEALTLEDFLAAAVPMEESERPERPKQEPSVRTKGRKHRRGGAAADPGPETVSTARENPAGLILTRNERSGQTKPAAAAAPASTRQEASRAETAPAGAQRSDEPVPSADVRPEDAFRFRRRSEQPEEEALPPEEKSVLHPDEAYSLYAKPLDAIGSRLVLTGLLTILSLFFTLYLSQHWTFLPEIFSGGTTVYILLGLLGLMVLVNRKLYFRDWRGENGLRPELLLGVATLFAALDAVPAAQELRPPFTVVVGALLIIALWGRYDRGLALITTVKVLRAEQLSAGVSEVQDITKGSRGLIRTEVDVERFMEKLETRDLTERMLRIYTPVTAVVCLALTLLVSIWLKKPPLWTGALIFLGGVPVTGLLAFPRLFCLLASRLSNAEAALCGYHGAEVFGGEHSILIGDEDIFPAGSLTLNGFKVYNGNPDRVIAYAAAACRSSGSALDPVFEDLLVTHNGRHYKVDNFRFYDSGGIGASIMQDVVLMGSLDFMRRMGVHMDKGARVKQAVYMSLNGELAAVFAVRYTPPENLRKGLAAIAGNRHFQGILVTRTFLGTPGFLKAKFGVPTGAFQYPSTKERIRLSEAEMKRSGAQGAILAKDSFSGFAQAAAGGRMLRSATFGAVILTVLGGLIGVGLMAILAALPAYETATAVNLLLYTAAWLAPTLLLTAWARHF